MTEYYTVNTEHPSYVLARVLREYVQNHPNGVDTTDLRRFLATLRRFAPKQHRDRLPESSAELIRLLLRGWLLRGPGLGFVWRLAARPGEVVLQAWVPGKHPEPPTVGPTVASSSGFGHLA